MKKSTPKEVTGRFPLACADGLQFVATTVLFSGRIRESFWVHPAALMLPGTLVARTGFFVNTSVDCPTFVLAEGAISVVVVPVVLFPFLVQVPG